MTNDQTADRERLRAPGRPVTLADGRIATVRFGLDGLCRLEEEFGSLSEFTAAINGPVVGHDADDGTARRDPTAGPFLTTLRRILAVALADQGVTYADLGDLFDLEQRWEYRSAIIDAYNEAMPAPGGAGKVSAGTSSSRGGTSTTPAPSDSAAAMASSGT